MVLQYNLVVSLVIVVAVVEDAHLLEALLVSLQLFLTSVLQDVPFDLFFAVLAQVVDLVAVPEQLLPLEVVEDVVKVFGGVRSTQGEDRSLGHSTVNPRNRLAAERGLPKNSNC